MYCILCFTLVYKKFASKIEDCLFNESPKEEINHILNDTK
jgi:hypothetical protein